jgi:hypothetical protein
MAELWETLRQAVATKIDTDVAAIRRATAGRPERRGGTPSAIVGAPRYTLDAQPNAHVDEYTLVFPCEVRVNRPAGVQRSEAAAADLMRLLQVAWRSGVKLGQGTYVVGSAITGAEPDLDEDPDLVGWQFDVTVTVHETFNPGRSA